MTSERLRLFVAARVPDEQLAWLQEQLGPLKSALPSARWIARSSQHVTLKFLGSVSADRLDDVVVMTERAAGRHIAADVALDGLGAFPSTRRATILWAGVRDDTGVLTGLAETLSASFETLGFAAEKRAFKPHLTVARFKSPLRVEQPAAPAGASAPFPVSAVSLYRSRLHPSGARYEVIHEAHLAPTACAPQT